MYDDNNDNDNEHNTLITDTALNRLVFIVRHT